MYSYQSARGFSERVPLEWHSSFFSDPAIFLSERLGLSNQLLRAAEEEAASGGVSLFELLEREGHISSAKAAELRAEFFRLPFADLKEMVLVPTLIQRLPYHIAIQLRVLPWRIENGSVLIAISKPERGLPIKELEAYFGSVVFVVAEDDLIRKAQTQAYAESLADAGKFSVDKQESCRALLENHWAKKFCTTFLISMLLLGVALGLEGLFILACFLAVGVLWAATFLKISAFIAFLRDRRRNGSDPCSSSGVTIPTVAELPRISILVPLHREKEILPHLVQRLSLLEYPRGLLEVFLVLEEDDEKTQDALKHLRLPGWMKPILVPEGGPKTKPRAMNIALEFCAGDIIGIYDAEDMPASDQLLRAAKAFASLPDEVVCLQGKLDYYNPKANWMARCFTIEYSHWFEVMLPGMKGLGFPLPLGGTTLFFRRDALEKLGRWDAFNVTEDADLGVRLARHGFKTAILDSITEEEANCRLWPWVRQRSRWLKGYMVTWLTHMRAPVRLLRELGVRKYFGFQLIFLTAILHFLLVPFLWSFWAALFGWDHPMISFVGPDYFQLFVYVFVISEIIHLVIHAVALSMRKHGSLMIWIPTLHIYYVFGTIASYKALLELIFAPYYWDKTDHGHSV